MRKKNPNFNLQLITRHFKFQRGQTIIEAVVALAAIMVIVAAITIAIVNAVSNSQFVKNQNLANKYAQQGMEYVKRIQVEDVDKFAQLESTYSLSGNESFELGAPTNVNIGTTHIRSVSFDNDVAPCINTENPNNPLGLKKVTVIVRWSSAKCPAGNSTEDRFCHNTTLVSCLPYVPKESVTP